jgi:succinate-acetate transporter protein
MFVPCIVRRGRNNQGYTQICATALFYMLAPTYFGSSLPSSGSFWIRLSYMKIQIDLVVYQNIFLTCFFNVRVFACLISF